MITDTKIIEPSVDPKTRKLAHRHVTALNDGGTKTKVSVRDFAPFHTDEPASLGGSNEAPSPIETLLGALLGCEAVILHGVAQAISFDYSGIELASESQIDVRGPKGVPGIRPYFEKVSVEVKVYTDEPDARFEILQKNVEFRCPIVNLLRAADVDLQILWSKLPKA